MTEHPKKDAILSSNFFGFGMHLFSDKTEYFEKVVIGPKLYVDLLNF